jgi:propionate CoA-transferase
LYVTERCVFALRPQGLELVEVAPGIDIESDILANMDFKPIIRATPDLMDARIFRNELMDLREDMLRLPLEQRFTFDPKQNLFFVNFERLPVRSRNDIRAIKETVEAKLAPLGRKVYAIVNYDNFSIVPELLDEYSAMVRGLMDHYYSGVSRYTTSGFLRMKLGESLERRGVAPHIFESAEDAQSNLRRLEPT